MSKIESSGRNKEYLTEHSISFDGIFPEDVPPQSRAAVNQAQKHSPTDRSAYANNVYSTEVDGDEECNRHSTQFPPGIQQIERGEIPENTDEDEVKETYKENLGCVIFKRLMSAIFIIIDGAGDWWNFSVMSNSIDNSTANDSTDSIFIDAFQRMIEITDAVKGSSKVECDTTTLTLTCVFAILLAFGTVYGVLQLINIFVETLMELVSKKDKKKKPYCLLFHGWVETFGSLLLQDIPQVIVLILFAGSCRREHVTSPWSLLLALVPLIKNIFRKSTCKQDKPLGGRGCRIRCFTFNVPFICFCTNYSCFKWVMCGHPPKREKLKNGEYDDGLDETYDPNKCVCCKCIPLVWECIEGIPCIGYCIICRHRGCCDNSFNQKVCCTWKWDICCKECFKIICKECCKSSPSKPKQKPSSDPTCVLSFFYILYVIDFALTGLLFAFKWLPNIFSTNDLFEILS